MTLGLLQGFAGFAIGKVLATGFLFHRAQMPIERKIDETLNGR
jgi:hypothetical protein